MSVLIRLNIRLNIHSDIHSDIQLVNDVLDVGYLNPYE